MFGAIRDWGYSEHAPLDIGAVFDHLIQSGTPHQFPAQLARYAEQLTMECEHSRGGATMKVAIIAVLLSMVSVAPALAATFVYVSNAEDGDIGMYTLQSD